MLYAVSATHRIATLAGWLTLAVVVVGTSSASADQVRDLLEEALDQSVSQVRIEDRPLREALAELEEATGVRFELDEGTLELMPYGARTRVALVIEDLPLRQGLEQLFDGLGLAMEVVDDRVRVRPAAVLERIGRRMTIKEVALLGVLAKDHWANLDHAAITRRFELDAKAEPPEALDELLTQVRAPNALRELEAATQALGWVWLPDGDTIVIRTLLADVEQRLDRPLDMSYQRTALDDLLVDLGRRIGVTMFFEPGSLQRVAARDSTVDIIQRGVRVRQILELVCGRTGLEYQVGPDGVHFSGPAGESPRSVGKSSRLYRVTFPLDDGAAIDVILRDDELPASVRDFVETKLEGWLNEMSNRAEGRP
ncbi:MAG: STN domain-containing protein [Phycisphaerae bacterium]|nr:STN domain-containing protein [Phycisphaerae bacterium]